MAGVCALLFLPSELRFEDLIHFFQRQVFFQGEPLALFELRDQPLVPVDDNGFRRYQSERCLDFPLRSRQFSPFDMLDANAKRGSLPEEYAEHRVDLGLFYED